MAGRASPGNGSYTGTAAPPLDVRAACRNTPVDMTALPHDYAGNRAAKHVCISCVIRVECLAWALDHDDVGVWGALTALERHHMRRHR